MSKAPTMRVKYLPNYPMGPNGEVLPKLEYTDPKDSGIDLRLASDGPVEVPFGSVVMAPTGVEVAIPPGYEAQIRPRSGLAVKGLTVVNAPGTIDEGYRGEINVLLSMVVGGSMVLTPGDRIAQMVIAPVTRVQIQEVEELETTSRGKKGFGSSGVK